MRADLVYHPSELAGRDLGRSCVVVLDLLRATTTMVTALSNGATEIRAYAELGEAERAASAFEGPKLLAGERRCLPPDGFDLGNSPQDFTVDRVSGRTIFMSTTNGTRAVRACATAARTFVASLVNATAMAQALVADGRDVLFVCAGVDGAPGGEDIDGAATIGSALVRLDPRCRPSERLAAEIRIAGWWDARFDRYERLRASPGGLNLAIANLDLDIEFAAEIDRYECVCEVMHAADHAVIRSVLRA